MDFSYSAHRATRLSAGLIDDLRFNGITQMTMWCCNSSDGAVLDLWQDGKEARRVKSIQAGTKFGLLEVSLCNNYFRVHVLKCKSSCSITVCIEFVEWVKSHGV